MCHCVSVTVVIDFLGNEKLFLIKLFLSLFSRSVFRERVPIFLKYRKFKISSRYLDTFLTYVILTEILILIKFFLFVFSNSTSRGRVDSFPKSCLFYFLIHFQVNSDPKKNWQPYYKYIWTIFSCNWIFLFDKTFSVSIQKYFSSEAYIWFFF